MLHFFAREYGKLCWVVSPLKTRDSFKERNRIGSSKSVSHVLNNKKSQANSIQSLNQVNLNQISTYFLILEEVLLI